LDAMQNSKAAGDSLLDVRVHAEIGINKDAEVSHSRRRSDGVSADSKCGPR